MTKLVLIRHGVTKWNKNKIVQGHTDIPLDTSGQQQVSNWILPQNLNNFRWISSPLGRATETANILSGFHPETDNRLIEMDWGQWEGCILDDLRQKLGDLMVAWEAKGLDFRAPDGESPREVQKRLKDLFSDIFKQKEDTIAVCHKGVIRAAYAMAVGWDMKSKPNDKILDNCLHIFEVEYGGLLSIVEMNVSM